MIYSSDIVKEKVQVVIQSVIIPSSTPPVSTPGSMPSHPSLGEHLITKPVYHRRSRYPSIGPKAVHLPSLPRVLSISSCPSQPSTPPIFHEGPVVVPLKLITACSSPALPSLSRFFVHEARLAEACFIRHQACLYSLTSTAFPGSPHHPERA